MLLQERRKVSSKGVAESDTPVKPVKCYKNVNTRSGSQVVCITDKATKQVTNPDTSIKPVRCYKNVNTRFGSQVIIIPKFVNTGTKDNAKVAAQNSTSVESPVATDSSQACDSGGQSSKTVNVQPKAPLLHIPQSAVKSLKIASKSVPIASKGRMILLNSPVLLNKDTLMEAKMDVIKQSRKAGGVDIASGQGTPVFEVIQIQGVTTSDDGDGTKSSTTPMLKSHCTDTSPFKLKFSDTSASISNSSSSDVSPGSRSCSSDTSTSKSRSINISISKSCSSSTSVSKSRSRSTSVSKSCSSDTSKSKLHFVTSPSKSHSSVTSHSSDTTMSMSKNDGNGRKQNEKQLSNRSVRQSLTTTLDSQKNSSTQLVIVQNKLKKSEQMDTTVMETECELDSPLGLKDGPVTLPVRENDAVILTNQLNISSKDNFSILKKHFQHHCACPSEQQRPVMTDQVIYEERSCLFRFFPNITMLLIHGQEIPGLFYKGRWYVSVSEVKCKLLSNQGRYFLENHLSRSKSGKKYLHLDLSNYLVTQNKIKAKYKEEYMVTVEYLKMFQSILNQMQRDHPKCDFWSLGSMDDNFYIKTKGRMWCKACNGHMVKESSVNVYTDFQFAPQEQEGSANKLPVGTMQASIVSTPSGALRTSNTAETLSLGKVSSETTPEKITSHVNLPEDPDVASSNFSHAYENTVDGLNVEGLVELKYVDETDPNINQFGYVMINKSRFTAFKVNDVCFVSIYQLLMEHVVSVYSSNHHLKNLNYRPRTAPAAVQNHLKKTDKVLSNSGWIDTNTLRCLCCLIWHQVFFLKKNLICSIICGEIEEHFTHAFQSTHNIENASKMATENFKIKDDGSIEGVSGPDLILTMATSRAGKKSVKRSCSSLSPRGEGRKILGETSGEGRKVLGETSGEGRKVAGETSGKRRKVVGETSGEGRKVVGETSGEGRKILGETSGEGRKILGETSGEGRKVVGETSGEGRKILGETSGEGRKILGETSGEGRKVAGETSGEGRKMVGETSGEGRKVAGETSGKRRKMVTDTSDQVSTENKSLKRSSSCLSLSTSGKGRRMMVELTDVNNGNHSIGQTEQLSEQSVCRQFKSSTKFVSLIKTKKRMTELPIILRKKASS